MIESYKHVHDDPMLIGDVDILPGEAQDIKILVGRLPSGNRLYMEGKVFRGQKPGPTVLLTGGIHGDEINGIQIVKEAIEKNYFAGIRSGTVIALPLVNAFGFINFSRHVPDGKDVNRSFPGSKNGSLAARVAHKVTHFILPYTDLILDFHTGGAFRYNYPQVRYHAQDRLAANIAKVFGMKFSIEKPYIANSLRKVAHDKGISTVVYEAGESVRLDGFCIENGLKGIRRVLHALDMVSEQPSPPSGIRIRCKKTSWIRAPHSGIFIWSQSSGTFVDKGEILGTISDPFAQKIVQVKSKYKGYIVGHNNASVVNQGDALFHVATDYEVM